MLRINHCSIGSDVLNTLADALRTNTSLQVLDLAFNNMTDKLALQLVSMIKDQAEQRDTLKWKQSLRKPDGKRGRQQSLHVQDGADADKSKPPVGLTEFIFHHNLLGRRFIEILAENIGNDIYVRKIDVSDNRIPEQPVLHGLIDSLRLNESLVNFDISSNPGCTSAVRH